MSETAKEAVRVALLKWTVDSASNTFDNGADVILSALAEAGYVVVPREPTPDMIGEAAMVGLRSARNGDAAQKQIEFMWEAMLSLTHQQGEERDG